jgi:hypothetical protein
MSLTLFFFIDTWFFKFNDKKVGFKNEVCDTVPLKCLGLPSLLGAANSPLLQNLVITREELNTLAATLGLPNLAAIGTTDTNQLIQKSLAETKVMSNHTIF